MMFKKESAEEIVSILGEGTEMVTDLSFSRGLRVDGVVNGKIRSEGLLVIGPKGKVEAELNVRKVLIDGEFHGIIRASDRVEIHNDGRVYGDIFTPCLIIEAGALFEGKCNMSDLKGASSERETPQLKAVMSAGDSEKSNPD
ncbi:MAG TPA: polymer-forming cytoskeletal protein [Acidobacteriota bacterium]|nr:polymer-forming cytoskeletal protein [Acidobacteriota bacterium]